MKYQALFSVKNKKKYFEMSVEIFTWHAQVLIIFFAQQEKKVWIL